jgi:hypothetical protein
MKIYQIIIFILYISPAAWSQSETKSADSVLKKTEIKWEFDNYSPSTGKEIGIHTKFPSETEYHNIRNILGFTNIFVYAQDQIEAAKSDRIFRI